VRDEAPKQSRAVFDAAADHFDDEPLAYSLDSGAVASSTLVLVLVIASSTWRVEAAPPRFRPPNR
jgi:hypothetical protein